jgi:DNA-binding transcriptional ArsR family regulator
MTSVESKREEPAPRVRRLDDPKAIQALAHPLRIRLLGLLRERGPSTATALAKLLGESSGSTSYHLRQLFKHGLIEEVEERGNSRERWWRAGADHFIFSTANDSPEHARAASRLRARMIERDAEIIARYIAAEDRFSRSWRQAAVFTNEVIHVTPQEMTALREQLLGLLEAYRRDDPKARPRTARRAFAVVRMVPWVETEPPAAPD